MDLAKSLQEVQDRVSILVNGAATDEERKKLLDGTFADRVQQAKENATAYALTRTKNGKKTTFTQDAGAARVHESLATAKMLRKIQDKVGLRSPAEQAYEAERRRLLINRQDKAWMEKNGKESLARMVFAKQYMDAKIPAKDQVRALHRDNWKSAYDRLQQQKEYQDFSRLGKLDALAEAALSNDEAFSKTVSALAKNTAAAYEKVESPKREEQIREDYMQGYAMEMAADEMHLSARRIDIDNPAIGQKATEIRQDPVFREAMERLMKGKSPEKLRKEKKCEVIGDTGRCGTMMKRIEYEKKCAELAVEMVTGDKLAKMSPEARSRMMTRQIAQCREMPAFQAFVDKKLEDVEVRDIEKMIDRLNTPAGREKDWKELSETMQKAVTKAKEPEPELELGMTPRTTERVAAGLGV